MEAIRAQFDDDDDEEESDSGEEEDSTPKPSQTERPLSVPSEEKEINIYPTIYHLILHLVRPTGARLERVNHLRSVVYKQRTELAVVLYDNYYTEERYEDWEVEAVRNVLGFTEPPQWLPGYMDCQWRILRHFSVTI